MITNINKHLREITRILLILFWLISSIPYYTPINRVKAAPHQISQHYSWGETPSGSVIYVNHSASGANNGTSWMDAFTQLQPALSAASSGDEIWVAQGVYTPTLETSPGNPRTTTFPLVDGVSLYGGFSGTGSETSLDERNLDLYTVVLDGDLNGDDDGFSNNTENSYHVVMSDNSISSATRLDGFVIQGGNANDGSSPDNQGAGIYNNGGNPRLMNLVVQNSIADSQGGGFYTKAVESDPSSGNPVLIRVRFIGNNAKYGGGIYNLFGEIYLYGVEFLGNQVEIQGGGMRNISGDPELVNCIFSGNHAVDKGGGIHNSSANPIINNATFSFNSATNDGGGIYNNLSSPQLNNSIFWDNDPDQIYDGLSSQTSIYQSLLEDGCPQSAVCTGVILSNDPVFRDADGKDSIAGTLDDNLRLKHSSPAIDAGSNSAVPLDKHDVDGDSNTSEKIPYDADFRPRFVDLVFVTDSGEGSPPIVDLGAYETRVIYVNDNASGNKDGKSWSNAFQSLSDALGISVYGDDVWVAHGTYLPTYKVDLNDPRSVTFKVPSGVALIGDFIGNENSRNQRQITLFSGSVLSGDLNGDDDGFTNNSENAYSVVTILKADTNMIMDGFTIRGGNADEYPYGSFLLNRPRQPQVDQTFDSGGGILNQWGSPVFMNLAFINNFAIQGGGVYTDYGDPYMLNCAWIGNKAHFGAGLRNHNSNSIIVNAIFSGNYAQGCGGGMYNTASSPAATNVSFTNNVAHLNEGDGVLNDFNSTFNVSNSIFWNNDSEQIYNLTDQDQTILRYSIVQGGCPARTTCVGEKSVDPLFIDADGSDNQAGTIDDNLQLLFYSPAIDAAENGSVPLDVFDINGNGNTTERLPFDIIRFPRFFDMDSVVDTGVGIPPIVDMGAYETQNHFVFLSLVVTK